MPPRSRRSSRPWKSCSTANCAGNLKAAIWIIERVRSLLAECAATKVPFDTGALAYAIKGHMERLSDQFLKSPENVEVLGTFAASADLIHNLPFGVNLWKPQNTCFQMLHAVLPAAKLRASQNDESAKIWLDKFRTVSDRLGLRVEQNAG